MGGGLLQLQRYGQQNEYLNGNPSLTYFKNVFKKHTHFSMETKRIEFEGIQSLATDVDTIMRCKIDRNGDLLKDLYFVMNLPDIYSGYEPDSTGTNIGNAYEFQWIPNIGAQIIKKATLTIGGSKVSELYGQWIEIYYELFLDTSEKNNFDRLIGHVPEIFFPAYNGLNNGFYPTSTLDPSLNANPDSQQFFFSNFAKNPYLQPPSIAARTIHVPIPFWFTRNPGLALPLIALQYHEVHIEFELRPISQLYTILETKENMNVSVGERTAPDATLSHHNISNFITSIPVESFNPDTSVMTSLNDGENNLQGWNFDCHLLANYVFLDKEERTKFALGSHDYLIEQTFRNSFTGVKGTRSVKLEFSHPVKYMLWTAQRNDVSKKFNGHNNYTNYDNEFIDPGSAAYIRRFGVDDADPLYFQYENGSIKEINGVKQTLDMLSNQRALIPTKFNFKFYEKNIIKSTRLLFDGVERYASGSSMYHQSLQAFQHKTKIDKFGLNMYSFELDASNLSPNGSCNFSRIDNVQLEVITIDPPPEKDNANSYDFNLDVYAINYNILRIQNGMGSTVFAN